MQAKKKSILFLISLLVLAVSFMFVSCAGTPDVTDEVSLEVLRGYEYTTGDSITFVFVESVYNISPESVVVAGSFNGWDPGASGWSLNKVEDGVWKLTKPLANVPFGSAFKFVADGEKWQQPPTKTPSEYLAGDGFGGFNLKINRGNIHNGFEIIGNKVIFYFSEYIYKLDVSPESVAVAGSFNGWDPSSAGWSLSKTADSLWTLEKPLSEAKLGSPFKFVMNGDLWQQPPAGIPDDFLVGDGHGGYNLLLSEAKEEEEAVFIEYPTEYNIDVPNDGWWIDAVFYQIWPRSFYDSTGDGHGDFNGMTEKLDYLSYLGIDAIWLTPMFEAPSYHGYDFVGFYDVEEDYGTMEDFENFLSEAKDRGIRVIADLVINHISNQSEWFIKSEQRIDPYTDYFVWSEEIPEGPWQKPWGGGEPDWVWHYSEIRGEYYYAVFDPTQPDINLENPEVVQTMKDIAVYWLDKGFSGFRLDAIRYLYENGPYPLQADQPETIDFWVDFTTHVKNHRPDAYLVGEVWADIDTIALYYSDGKSIDQNYDFEFGNEVINILKEGEASVGEASFGDQDVSGLKGAGAIQYNIGKKDASDAPLTFFAPFLTNHDQDRIMYQLDNDLDKIRLAAVLLFTTVGTPTIYYGEEIGMTQFSSKTGYSRETNSNGCDRFVRTPMQWDASDNAGFNTTGELWMDDGKWFPWLPNYKPFWSDYWNSLENREAFTVAGQMDDPDSLLNLYKNLIRVRKENPEFTREGRLEFFETESDSLIGYARESANGVDSSILLMNVSDEALEVTIPYVSGKTFTNHLTGEKVTFNGDKVQLGPLSFLLLKVD